MPGGNPMILGHEACGVVEWVGSEVSRVRPGQRVIVSLTPVCGTCWFCRRQETHLCEMGPEVMAQPRAERADGSVANAMSGVGSFADVMTVDEASCIPVDTDLPADQLALIGCGFTTGFGAAINTAQVDAGATVAVIGCGGVGTSAIQGAASRRRVADHRDRPRGNEAPVRDALRLRPTRSTRARAIRSSR